MKAARSAAVVLALAILAGGVTLARSEVVQKGHLRVAFAGAFSPQALPRDGAAPVSVSIGGSITSTGAAKPPQLRTISIAINRNAHLDPGALPKCRLDEIQPATDEGALAACGASLVGRGSFSADVELPEQSPFPSTGRVLAFSGRLKGKPVVLAHVYGTDPVPTSYTLPFAIKRSKGTFGTVLATSLPQVTADWGFVTAINLRLGRQNRYLTASCPAPSGFTAATFPLARATFAFAGGRALSSKLNRACQVRGH